MVRLKSSTVESPHQNRVKKGASDGGIGSMLSSDHVQGGPRWGRGLGRLPLPEVEGKIPGAPIFDSLIFEGLWGTPQNTGLFQPKQRYFWVVEKLQNMF